MSLDIFWEVTNACNLRCKSCLPASMKPRANELTKAEILDGLEKLTELGATSVQFSGGEPFQRPDFLTIVSEATDLGLAVGLTSNGAYIDSRNSGALAESNASVTISLDGAERQTHDFVRGRGSFDAAMSALEVLSGHGVPASIAFTVMRPNCSEIVAIAELGRKFSCRRITYSEIVFGGRAERNWQNLSLLPDQKRNLAENVRSAAMQAFGDADFERDDRCWVDGSSLYVSAEGFIYLCSEIFQRAPKFFLTNVRNPECQKAIEEVIRTNQSHRPCCFEVYGSSHTALVANLDRNCALIGKSLGTESPSGGQ